MPTQSAYQRYKEKYAEIHRDSSSLSYLKNVTFEKFCEDLGTNTHDHEAQELYKIIVNLALYKGQSMSLKFYRLVQLIEQKEAQTISQLLTSALDRLEVLKDDGGGNSWLNRQMEIAHKSVEDALKTLSWVKQWMDLKK